MQLVFFPPARNDHRKTAGAKQLLGWSSKVYGLSSCGFGDFLLATALGFAPGVKSAISLENPIPTWNTYESIVELDVLYTYLGQFFRRCWILGGWDFAINMSSR